MVKDLAAVLGGSAGAFYVVAVIARAHGQSADLLAIMATVLMILAAVAALSFTDRQPDHDPPIAER